MARHRSGPGWGPPRSSHARAREGVGRPLVLARARDVAEPAVRAGPPVDRVAAADEIVVQERIGPGRGHVVARRHERDPDAPELAARVVLVAEDRGPAVLVEVEDPLRVDVALA